jgi:hypothetical protein
MVKFQKNNCNFLPTQPPTPTHTGIRENFAVLDAFDLILASANGHASGAPWESSRILLFSWYTTNFYNKIFIICAIIIADYTAVL